MCQSPVQPKQFNDCLLKLPQRLLLIGLVLCLGDSESMAQRLWWGSDAGIQRANSDGSNVEELVTKRHPPFHATGIDVDLAGGKIYWTEFRSIHRSDLTGHNVEELVRLNTNQLYDVALDIQGGKMYWAAGFLLPHAGKIQRANLDGSNVEDLVVDETTGPVMVALDLTAGKMYWTDWSLDIIRRANLDGTDVEDVITTGFLIPEGIALDPLAGKVYWTDRGFGVQRANFDGTQKEMVAAEVGGHAYAIEVESSTGKVYWADRQSRRIRRANGDGTALETVVETYASGLSLQGEQVYLVGSTISRLDLPTLEMVDLFVSPIGDVRNLALHRAAGKLLWSEDTLRRANLDGMSIESFGPDAKFGDKIVVDASTNQLFTWTDDMLLRSNVDGTNLEPIDTGGLTVDYPYSVSFAIDLACGTAFIATSIYAMGARVRAVRLDGSHWEDVLTISGNDQFGDMVIDAAGRDLYWNFARSEDRKYVGTGLVRISLDDWTIEDVPFDAYLFTYIDTLWLSPTEQKLYWIDQDGGSSIRRANLDGSEPETVIPETAWSLAVDGCTRNGPVQSDAADFLTACLSGPWVLVQPECACSDFTGEGFVDLRDAAAMQLNLE